MPMRRGIMGSSRCAWVRYCGSPSGRGSGALLRAMWDWSVRFEEEEDALDDDAG
jgi:hypothetical protein